MNADIADLDVLIGADQDTLTEIMREAEIYLSAQLTASIAADQRAMNFSGLLSAATVALVAAGAALILSTNPFAELGWVCLVVALAFIGATAFANRAAMPTDFWYVGNSPRSWLSDVRNGIALKDALASQALHYSDMIKANDDLMRSNNRMMGYAVWVSWFSLAVGVVFGIGLLASH